MSGCVVVLFMAILTHKRRTRMRPFSGIYQEEEARRRRRTSRCSGRSNTRSRREVSSSSPADAKGG